MIANKQSKKTKQCMKRWNHNKDADNLKWVIRPYWNYKWNV